MRAALDAVPPATWSLPSTFAATGVHHGYRRAVMVSHGHIQAAAEPFRFVLDMFSPVHEAWLSWIDPGGFIVPHRDAGPWLDRWQVPIVAVGWFRQGDRFEPESGKPFQVRHWAPHCVGNPTGTARVHLVLDRDVRSPRKPEPFQTFPIPAELDPLVSALSQEEQPVPRKPNPVTYRATTSFAVFDKDGTPRVVQAEELVGEDDPLVLTHRQLLQPVAEYVEQATARPGEVRAVHIPEVSDHEGETDDVPSPRAS